MEISFFYIKDGTLWLCEEGVSQKVPLATEGQISSIAQGDDQTFVLESDGSCWYEGRHSIFNFDYYGDTLEIGKYKFRKIKTPNKFKSISCGILSSVLAIDEEDKIYGVGNNQHGELGLGRKIEEIYNWSHVKDQKFETISRGCFYSIALDKNGALWSCGWNLCGNLGFSSIIPSFCYKKFERVSKNKFTFIACGNKHTMALDLDGHVWGCGDNLFGQLGLGDTNDRYSLTKLQWNRQFKYVSCGADYTVLIDIGGNVWSAGDNTYGQLGNPNSKFSKTFEQFSRKKICQTVFEQVFKNQNSVLSSFCHRNATFLLTECHNVWICGYNGGYHEHEMEKNFYEFKLLIPDSVNHLPNEPSNFFNRLPTKSAKAYN